MVSAFLVVLCSSLLVSASAVQKRYQKLVAAATAETDRWSPGVAAGCPCSDASWCKPISGPPLQEKEVYGFVGDPNTMNWTHVTTVAWATDPALICAAHQHGARVVMSAPSVVLTSNKTARTAWIKAAAEQMQAKFMDGIVFDYENPEKVRDDNTKNYALLISETTAYLHYLNPSYQTSTCVAWSPDDIDGRGYDIPALAAASDVLYVMDYDTRSQVFTQCIASANAPLPGMIKGIQRYLDLGVSPDQLILGVPWYGYQYKCLAGTAKDAEFCPIPLTPFRGVNCSDAAGSEVAYKDIMKLLPTNTAHGFDSNMAAPWFNVERADGTVVQYWYDNAESLGRKYAWAKTTGLRGVGPFTFTDLDPTNAPDQAREIWSTFDVFVH